MAKGSASGHSLGKADIPVVLGMAARGDRNHDIAAWFGVNQGRVAEAKGGEYGNPPAAPGHQLPPSGAPGIKGRRLHGAVNKALSALENSTLKDSDARGQSIDILKKAIEQFDTNEG